MRTTLRWLLVAALPCVGCGGSESGGPGDPIPADEGVSLCAAFGEHATTCGWGGNVNGSDWNCGDATVVWRADAFRTFVACATVLPCDGDGASCYAETSAAIEPLDIHEEYSARCTARSTECGLVTLGCSTDFRELYTATIMEQLVACLDQDCPMIEACVTGVL